MAFVFLLIVSAWTMRGRIISCASFTMCYLDAPFIWSVKCATPFDFCRFKTMSG